MKRLLASILLLFASAAFAQVTTNPSVTGVFDPQRAPGATALKGTITNDSATTGNIGEFLSSYIAYNGATVSLTTGTAVDITSISLTAGDWDVRGVCAFTGNVATTYSYMFCGINTTSATIPIVQGGKTSVNSVVMNGTTPVATLNPSFLVGPTRISIATTTTVYLVTQVAFAVSTAAAFGTIEARRVR